MKAYGEKLKYSQFKIEAGGEKLVSVTLFTP
jgi:hypothetical protein